MAHALKPVLGLEFLHLVQALVDKTCRLDFAAMVLGVGQAKLIVLNKLTAEARAATTTEGGLEAKQLDASMVMNLVPVKTVSLSIIFSSLQVIVDAARILANFSVRSFFAT